MTYRLGIDIGGTFTDFALLDEDTHRLVIHKHLTTPDDPSAAVLSGIEALLARTHVGIAALSGIVHGTTLVTNALIERRGAVTGMLYTEGFPDVLDIAMERRYDLYDLRITFPRPLIPRARRASVAERMDATGTVRTPLDLDAVDTTVRRMIETHGIEALAVCLLHSYVNPAHEQAIRDRIAQAFPSLYISVSSEVFPFMREYERWTTTTMNAYVQPMLDRYLGRLEQGLAAMGYAERLYIMSSSGGMVTPEIARRFPVRILESGPAAGVLMSALQSRLLGLPNVLSFDMGGTTAKGSLVRAHRPLKRYEMEVARVHQFRRGSGLPAKIPVIDMIEIGSGGGSIAEIDARGVIRVGPHSAGADPGPACYRRGGDKPTLSDANLVLGYYDAATFLGGTMPLDKAAALKVIERDIAAPLKLDAMRAAFGIHEIVNEDVARAFRTHASERGFDYRVSSMVAFGGSGPAHALRIARKLRVPKVVLPMGAGVMSAIGMLVSPLSFEVVRSDRVTLAALDRGGLESRFGALEAEAGALLETAGVAARDIRYRRWLDMRYCAQGYDIEVATDTARGEGLTVETLGALFHDAYRRVFSLAFPDEPAEIINWKVEASGPVPKGAEAYALDRAPGAGAAGVGVRSAYFPELGGSVDCPVYSRYALSVGATVKGPALIEEAESTCVVGAGDEVTVDVRGNLIARVQVGGTER